MCTSLGIRNKNFACNPQFFHWYSYKNNNHIFNLPHPPGTLHLKPLCTWRKVNNETVPSVMDTVWQGYFTFCIKDMGTNRKIVEKMYERLFECIQPWYGSITKEYLTACFRKTNYNRHTKQIFLSFTKVLDISCDDHNQSTYQQKM